MVNLVATIPTNYPEESLPTLDIEIIKGLSEDNKNELLVLANNEAEFEYWYACDICGM